MFVERTLRGCRAPGPACCWHNRVTLLCACVLIIHAPTPTGLLRGSPSWLRFLGGTSPCCTQIGSTMKVSASAGTSGEQWSVTLLSSWVTPWRWCSRTSMLLSQQCCWHWCECSNFRKKAIQLSWHNHDAWSMRISANTASAHTLDMCTIATCCTAWMLAVWLWVMRAAVLAFVQVIQCHAVSCDFMQCNVMRCSVMYSDVKCWCHAKSCSVDDVSWSATEWNVMVVCSDVMSSHAMSSKEKSSKLY